jgi:Leucine-rich repeat (LRR) protein
MGSLLYLPENFGGCLLCRDLSGNALSSPLPPEFSVLTNLKHLDLSVNRLVGTLPPQWSTHKQLEIL